MQKNKTTTIMEKNSQQITTSEKPLFMDWLKEPMLSLKNVKAASIEQAASEKSSCIAVIAGMDLAITKTNTAIPLLITELITSAALFLNVSRNMEVEQVKQTVDLIMNDHVCRNLTPEDFKVCFDMIKKNSFQKNFYERFDGQIIFECLYSYANEKAAYIEQQKRNQHETKKREPVSVEVLEGLKTLSEKLKTESKKKPYSKKTREKTSKEKTIQKYFKEFFELWKSSGVAEKFGRFIEYKGVTLSEEEYVQARIKEDNV